ncbi:MAG TPA: hypothetical protein RMH99_23180 [Sandaracinaceae bacterium LLY-WYZ-13_1]|nr:hypothetical protein [Sandaracinaceae bacterium LLY-WYZ-13_1]
MRPLRLLPLALFVLSCDGGGLPEGWRETPAGDGPLVRWELEAEPLPEIPLPNDVATWPDPSSPTGRRVNASLVAPSGMERRLRQEFDRLDGWGTFAPITVGFEAPIDTDDVIRRQGGRRFSASAWQRHAVYLVDMETGVPVPLDVNSELFPRAVVNPNGYYANDPHAGESNLLFETREEDTNGNGVLDPGEDTDFDGVLDHPNTLDGTLTGAPYETIDRMLWFYERETDTMVLRPILPLAPRRQYAVVLTDRLRGRDGQPVRSPFPYVHHTAQREELRALPERLAAHPEIYGDVADRGWDGVAFAWSFTTQSVGADLGALRDGLYGRGPFADLAEEFPPRLVPSPLRGGSRTERCDPGPRVHTVTPAELNAALEELPVDSFGVPIAQLDAVLATLEASVSHFAFGFFESPYLLGDPDAETPNDTWQIDRATGEARVERDLVPMFIIVPKETETHRQPFPTTLYAHGYGSLNLEALAFAGLIARHGVATVSITAQGHGLPLDESLGRLIEAVLAGNCLAPLGKAIALDRARDLNGDGTADSAGLFFSAYMFHTRDALRQTVLDWMQAVRILRSWSGHPDFPDGTDWEPTTIELEGTAPIEFSGDVDGDGAIDRAGDFDGDGVNDLGGWDAEYRQWGSSLGGIVSMLNTGAEPSIRAASPVSGGGGLFDVGVRTSLSSARHPIWLRVMGPILASRPSDGPGRDTACEAGARSVFFELPDLGERTVTEVACLPEDNLAEGDAVVLRNLRNGEVRCAGVGADGRFRLQMPSSEGDRLVLVVYDDALERFDYGDCSFEGDEPPVLDVLETWRSGNGTSGAGRCATCASYQDRVFEVGSPLVAPTEGLGLRRQSPDLRRLAGLAQIAVDPADPVNYARRVFLDPVTAPDVEEGRPRSVLAMSTAGDEAVPPSASYAYARAAGVLPFMPPDAPDAFADWRAPAWVAETWGPPTPDGVLVQYHAIEGLARLERHPVEGAPRFLFDVDDLSEGRQFFAPNGRRQLPQDEGGIQPRRLDPPLRWGRESRLASAAGGDPWRTESEFAGTSLVLNAMTLPTGQHVLLPVDPTKVFDESEYLLNVIGWYLASGGTELAYQRLEDPFCLEDSSCARE